MALLSLVGRQTQRLDMDQAFNPLSGSARFQGTGECFDSDNSYTLTTPGPAAGQVGNEGRTASFPSSDLCCTQGITNHLFAEVCVASESQSVGGGSVGRSESPNTVGPALPSTSGCVSVYSGYPWQFVLSLTLKLLKNHS